jgi:hypothetical protein
MALADVRQQLRIVCILRSTGLDNASLSGLQRIQKKFCILLRRKGQHAFNLWDGFIEGW